MDDCAIPARAKVTGLYINSALAKTEAQENGYDEAIMLTNAGFVSRLRENVFVVIDGALVPAPSENILIGITRNTVIELARKELGIPVVERQVAKTELYTAGRCS